MSNWIPTENELPDDNETVIVHALDNDPPVWLGYYDAGDWYSVDSFACYVTHWMPLPEPPEFRP